MDHSKLAHVLPHTKQIAMPSGGFEYCPEKAYGTAFINSSGAKPLRILAEYLETEQRLSAAKVQNTILFFGSARSKSSAELKRAYEEVDENFRNANPEDLPKLQLQRTHLDRIAWLSPMYDQVVDLSRRLAQWGIDRIKPVDPSLLIPNSMYSIVTGGGPGLMRAANEGASRVPGAVNIGAGISLPFESGVNEFVTDELRFIYHYFFMRKFSMVYKARAFVSLPGGYGTMDELFEVLTLLQTGKIDFPDYVPVVLFGKAFWKGVINFDFLRDMGTIHQSDIDRIFFTDSVDEAFDYIVDKLNARDKLEASKSSIVDIPISSDALMFGDMIRSKVEPSTPSSTSVSSLSSQ